jgi:DNA-binding Xre family transcriptional regulator
MEKKGISQYRLIKSGIDNRTIDSLKNNRNITMNTLEKICKIINCTPNDVVRFK